MESDPLEACWSRNDRETSFLIQQCKKSCRISLLQNSYEIGVQLREALGLLPDGARGHVEAQCTHVLYSTVFCIV